MTALLNASPSGAGGRPTLPPVGADGLALSKAIVAERTPKLYRLCPYCGRPSRGFTCTEHRDLPDLDVNTPRGAR